MKVKSLVLVTVLAIAVFGFGCCANAQNVDISAQIAQLQAQIASLLARIQALQAQQGATATATAWCHTFNTNLGYANSGSDEVENLHTALQKENILYGVDAANIYGEDTMKAVTKFQGKYNIIQTGYVGASTRVKLNYLYRCGATSHVLACTDSDGGQFPNVAGFTDGRVNGVGSYYSDSCVTSNGGQCSGDSCTSVSEGYCTTSGEVTNILTPCSTGYCQNGACATRATTQSPIVITSPNGGESLNINSPIAVTWNMNYSTASNSVSIFVVSSSTSQKGYTSSLVAGKNGVNQFTIPANSISSAGQYKVQICDHSTSTITNTNGTCDSSDDYFNVVAQLTTQSTTVAIGGVCGSANGVATATAPVDNLCLTGNGTLVPGSSQLVWTWLCSGTNFVATASCSAPRISSTPASVTVISPNGGESFAIGQPISVTWTSLNMPTSLSLGFSTVGIQLLSGDSVVLTSDGVVNSGHFSFPLTSTIMPGNQYRIKIRWPAENTAVGSVNGGSTNPILAYDTSDSYFTIVASTTALTTCTPNWNCGAWNTCADGQQTRTCADLNSCGVTTSRPSLAQACTFATTGGNYSVTVISPNGGETYSFQRNSANGFSQVSIPITWTSTGLYTNTGCVKIQLLQDNSVAYDVTGTGTGIVCIPNRGNYPLILGTENNITPGSNFKIRVYYPGDQYHPANWGDDTSDSYFIIAAQQ